MAKVLGFEERKAAVCMRRSGVCASEVAEQLQASVSWVYKWYQRYQREKSWESLKDQSRAPKNHPNTISAEVRQAIRQVRSELEAEAASARPGDLCYIGSGAIRARLKKKHPSLQLPSLSSIERTIRAAGMIQPAKPEEPAPVYPHLHPTEPHQLIQIDIVPHFLPGGISVSCFNAIDVVSRYPTGQQYLSKYSQDAALFLVQVWKELGLAKYTQVDNEGCFSGGFTHPGVLGKVVRLALYVGTELVFSPIRHPESNGFVERFHQDYNKNVWHKLNLPKLADLHAGSQAFFKAYRQSEHSSALQGHCPAEIHFEHPLFRLPDNFSLPQSLPVTEGQVHFLRLVNQDRKISILNLNWDVPAAQPEQGIWATIRFLHHGARLRAYDAAPDAPRRTCLAEHPFPLKEPVLPLQEEFQRPISVDPSFLSLAANLFRTAFKVSIPDWLSTMF